MELKLQQQRKMHHVTFPTFNGKIPLVRRLGTNFPAVAKLAWTSYELLMVALETYISHIEKAAKQRFCVRINRHSHFAVLTTGNPILKSFKKR